MFHFFNSTGNQWPFAVRILRVHLTAEMQAEEALKNLLMDEATPEEIDKAAEIYYEEHPTISKGEEESKKEARSIVEGRARIISDNRKIIRLEVLAGRDAMTGLNDKGAYQRNIAKHLNRIERTPGEHLSLIAFDIDHFKRVNDSFGHSVGDEVLKILAQILDPQIKDPLKKGPLREMDYLFRVGGEEFMVILQNTNAVDAEKVAERLKTTVKDNLGKELKKLHPGDEARIDRFVDGTISLGIATVTGEEGKPALTPDEFSKRADAAMYWSKKKGRNQYTAWTEGMEIPLDLNPENWNLEKVLENLDLEKVMEYFKTHPERFMEYFKGHLEQFMEYFKEHPGQFDGMMKIINEKNA